MVARFFDATPFTAEERDQVWFLWRTASSDKHPGCDLLLFTRTVISFLISILIHWCSFGVFKVLPSYNSCFWDVSVSLFLLLFVLSNPMWEYLNYEDLFYVNEWWSVARLIYLRNLTAVLPAFLPISWPRTILYFVFSLSALWISHQEPVNEDWTNLTAEGPARSGT